MYPVDCKCEATGFIFEFCKLCIRSIVPMLHRLARCITCYVNVTMIGFTDATLLVLAVVIAIGYILENYHYHYHHVSWCGYTVYKYQKNKNDNDIFRITVLLLPITITIIIYNILLLLPPHGIQQLITANININIFYPLTKQHPKYSIYTQSKLSD